MKTIAVVAVLMLGLALSEFLIIFEKHAKRKDSADLRVAIAMEDLTKIARADSEARFIARGRQRPDPAFDRLLDQTAHEVDSALAQRCVGGEVAACLKPTQ